MESYRIPRRIELVQKSDRSGSDEGPIFVCWEENRGSLDIHFWRERLGQLPTARCFGKLSAVMLEISRRQVYRRSWSLAAARAAGEGGRGDLVFLEGPLTAFKYIVSIKRKREKA